MTEIVSVAQIYRLFAFCTFFGLKKNVFAELDPQTNGWARSQLAHEVEGPVAVIGLS